MSYLVQSTVPYSLTIGSKDCTDRLLQFSVSDSSAYDNGIVTTRGTISIGTIWDQDPYSVYGEGEFPRGAVVSLTMLYPNGQTGKHPRGTLRVIGSSYSPQDEKTIIEVGCEIAYKKLIDDTDDLLSYAPYKLAPAQQTYEGLSSSLAARGAYIYADKDGNIQEKYLFGLDGNTPDYPKFVSIRGVTALSVAPLAAGTPIPDKIEIDYSYPEEDKTPIGNDGNGERYEQLDETFSYYFVSYPAIHWVRVPIDPTDQNIEDELIEDLVEADQIIPLVTPCGDSPETPEEAPPGTEVPEDLELEDVFPGDTVMRYSCSSRYATKQTQRFLPALRKETRISKYHGPAGQLSYQVSFVHAPLLEANQSYFADKYDYCRRVYGNPCNPNGPCPKYGIDGDDSQALIEKRETFYTYGEANEVVRTVQDTYVTLLSASDPSDYRAGNPDELDPNKNIFDLNFDAEHQGLFLYQRIITTNNTSDKRNINEQTAVTLTSATARQAGIYSYSGPVGERIRVRRPIDATEGFRTVVYNRSTSTASFQMAPERIEADTTSTVEKTTTVYMPGGGNGSGTYVMKSQVPISLDMSAGAARRAANTYGNVLAKSVIGDALGLQIGESLRSDIVSNWYPSVGFHYHDEKHGRLVRMQMDSSSWAVDLNSSAVATSGMFVSKSNGTVVLPSNLTGNATPDMSGGNDPGYDPDPEVPPGVIDDEPVGETFTWSIDTELELEITVDMPNGNGIVPNYEFDPNIDLFQTIGMSVRGMIVQPGALLETDPSGGFPLNFQGNLVVDNSLIITGDLFA